MPGHEKQLISYVFETTEINDGDLVELRGFEPPTCAVRAPTPIDAATASKLSYCRGRSAGSDSDRRCFTYTA